jgi:hypothetical protein
LEIWTVKPSEVALAEPKVGVRTAFRDVEDTVAEPLEYPVRVVVTVTVDDVPVATSVTVTTPEPSIETVPPAVTDPA